MCKSTEMWSHLTQCRSCLLEHSKFLPSLVARSNRCLLLHKSGGGHQDMDIPRWLLEVSATGWPCPRDCTGLCVELYRTGHRGPPQREFWGKQRQPCQTTRWKPESFYTHSQKWLPMTSALGCLLEATGDARSPILQPTLDGAKPWTSAGELWGPSWSLRPPAAQTRGLP